MNDFYTVLRIQRTASPAQIRAAFRSLAMRFHPDINQSSDAHDRFVGIYEAYSILIDPTKRNMYDRILCAGAVPQSDISEMSSWRDSARSRSESYSGMRYTEFLRTVRDELKAGALAFGLAMGYGLLSIFARMGLIVALGLSLFSMVVSGFLFPPIVLALNIAAFLAIIAYLVYLDIYAWRKKYEDKAAVVRILERGEVIAVVVAAYVGCCVAILFRVFR